MDGKSIISSSLLYYKQYFVVKSMNIPATKEEILENFKKNSNGRPLNKDDYEIAEALSRITYKAYEGGMEDAKQLNMEDMMDKYIMITTTFDNKEEANNAFIKVVVDPDTAPDYIEFKIDGYTYDEWVHDFRILYIKISASKKLDAVSKAIKQLEDYYSDDKQTENKFNALLSDIANIMK